MTIAEPFIRRPIGTTLLALGLVPVGIVASLGLPVAPLPQVEFPTIQVSAKAVICLWFERVIEALHPRRRRLRRLASCRPNEAKGASFASGRARTDRILLTNQAQSVVTILLQPC
jgi:AcrB/AcrD/AcrF family